MRSLIFSTSTRFLAVLLLLFGFFLLLRGHDEPGGGFVGGLLVASSFTLVALAEGEERASRLLRFEPRRLVGTGILMLLASGTIAWFAGEPFLTVLWLPGSLPGLGKVGTALLFDIGVLLVVAGTVLAILLTVGKE